MRGSKREESQKMLQSMWGKLEVKLAQAAPDQVIDQRYHTKQRSRISYSNGKMRSRLQRIYAGRRCKGKQHSRISCLVARVMNV